MCKLRTQRFQCDHAYFHRVSACLRRRSPQNDYACSNINVLPTMKLRSFCPPCSKRKWADSFWREYKEVETRCGADSQAAQELYSEFERACDALDKLCSRDQPFWSKMPMEDYVAAGGTMEDTKTHEHGAKSEKQKRKRAESSLYYLRRRQSNFKAAVVTAPSKGLVEKAEATDRDLLQQHFARTTISATHKPVETIDSLDDTDSGDQKAEECAADSSSAESNARSAADMPRRQEVLPNQSPFGETDSLPVMASSPVTQKSQNYHSIRHDSVMRAAEGKQAAEGKHGQSKPDDTRYMLRSLTHEK
ncbi:hypothetical protein AC579_5702 [Pseudocercospora musae]|uniref:Uncharacterized protein n=1 Tax=Pseudocercospora musae TaxID=113226 RepID=A0A139IRM3_9PEZI|nr:hypothetical protein AC579_5702 [Pseudocercospora musae]